MTKDWTFDQPLDDNTPTSSTEERAKIAALFHKENQESVYQKISPPQPLPVTTSNI